MARARLLKPGFFQNDELAELPMEARLLFIGLWGLADREGRLNDRPKRIGVAVFPYDSLDVEPLLAALHESGFIGRYAAEGKRYIQVVNFLTHQKPHYREPESMIPPSSANEAPIIEQSSEHAPRIIEPPCAEEGVQVQKVSSANEASMIRRADPTGNQKQLPVTGNQLPETVAEAVSDAAATDFQKLERLWMDVSGQTLNRMAGEQLLSWIDDGHFLLVEAGMEKAGLGNKKNFNWMKAVVNGWIDNGGRDDLDEKKPDEMPEPLPISPAIPGTEYKAEVDWGVILRALKEQVNAATYRTWLVATAGVYVSSEGWLHVSCPTQSAANWLEDNMHTMVMAAVGDRYPDVRFIARVTA